MAVDHSKLPQLVRKLRRCDAKLLAENVETREEFERCHKLGFDLFQGYYFARPTVITGRRIDPDRMALLSMRKQLSAEVEIDVLCESIKHNAKIGVSVLRLVNSAAMTSRTKIATVSDAVNYRGRRHLTRWLTVLLFAGTDEEGLASPLLMTAAKRGRLMELLVKKLPRRAIATTRPTAPSWSAWRRFSTHCLASRAKRSFVSCG